MADENIVAGPSIVHIRGFFDQLLPGIFVLLHIWLATYWLSDTNTRKEIASLVQFPIVLMLITLPAGYLIGLALRMFRTGFADRWSVMLLLLFPKGRGFLRLQSGDRSELQEKAQRTKREILDDRFPYPGLMRIRIDDQLPAEASEFFNLIWSDAVGRRRRTTVFTFEFWKVLLASVDPQAAREANSREVAVRLAAHTCYALFMCVGIMIPVAIMLLHRGDAGHAELFAILIALEFPILLIMTYNFRFFRTGEVEHVFSVCFRHRVALKRIIEGDSSTGASSAGA